MGASIHEGALGLNSALARLVDQAWEQDLALITGVGYPAQDRSHFRSIQHWESGRTANESESWVTQSLDRLSGQNSIAGLSLVDHMRLFRGGSGIYSSFSDYPKCLSLRGKVQSLAVVHCWIPLIVAKPTHATEIFRVSLRRPEQNTAQQFSRSSFGRQTESVLRLAKGLVAPIFTRTMEVSDTHRSQRNRHNALLRGPSMIRFVENGVDQMGLWDQFLVMTHSEFGRTAKENANGGLIMAPPIRTSLQDALRDPWSASETAHPRKPYQHTLITEPSTTASVVLVWG